MIVAGFLLVEKDTGKGRIVPMASFVVKFMTE